MNIFDHKIFHPTVQLVLLSCTVDEMGLDKMGCHYYMCMCTLAAVWICKQLVAQVDTIVTTSVCLLLGGVHILGASAYQ